GLALPATGTLSNSTVSANEAAGGAATTAGTGPDGRAGDARGGGPVAAGGPVTNSTPTPNPPPAGGRNPAARARPGRRPARPHGGRTRAGNAASTASPDVARPAPPGATSLGNNLVGDGTGAPGFVGGTGGDRVGTAAAPIDPRLGPLADNGGPTPTHAPL